MVSGRVPHLGSLGAHPLLSTRHVPTDSHGYSAGLHVQLLYWVGSEPNVSQPAKKLTTGPTSVGRRYLPKRLHRPRAQPPQIRHTARHTELKGRL